MIEFINNHFYGHYIQFWSLSTLYYTIVVVAILLIESVLVGYKSSSIRRLYLGSVSARNDIFCELLHIFGLIRPMTMIFCLGVPFWLSGYYESHVHFNFLQNIENAILAYAVWFIVSDFIAYWTHRFSHDWLCWWQVHKYHHSALEFNIITGNRNHILDDALSEFLRFVPLLLLGPPPIWFFYLWLTRLVIDLWQHSSINWNYGWLGEWVIFSPLGHKLHHSNKAEHWNKNFGNIFVIWDKLFGTWHAHEDHCTIGVSDNIYNKDSVLKNWLIGFITFFTQINQSYKTGIWSVRSKH